MVKTSSKFVVSFILLVWILPLIVTFLVINKIINIYLALPFAFIPLGIWFFVLFYWMFSFQNKRRRELIRECNKYDLGYDLETKEGEKIISDLKEFKIFNIGFLPMMLHIIKGKWKDIPVMVFDYRYNAGIPAAQDIIRYQTIVYFYFKNKKISKTIFGSKNFTIEANGSKVIYYKKDVYLKPSELSNFLDKALEEVNNFFKSKK